MSTTGKNTQKLLSASLIITALDTFRNIILAHIMGPSLTGLCTSILIIPQVAQYLNLGLIEALTVHVPEQYGKGDKSKIHEIKNTVLSLTFLISLLSFLAVFAYVAMFRTNWSTHSRFILMAGLLIILWELKQFFTTHYLIEGKIGKLSRVELGFTAITTAIQIGLIHVNAGYGFWLGLIIPHALIILYAGRDYFRANPLKKITHESVEAVRRILPLGTSLLIASVNYTPFIIMGRIFVVKSQGIKEAGLFFLATIIISKISIIPNAITKVILPRFAYMVGNNEVSSKEPFSLFVKMQAYTLGIVLLCLGLGYLLLEPAVQWLLPHYYDGIPAAKAMIIGGIPYALIDHANSLLLAHQQKRTYLLNLIISLFFTLAMLWYLNTKGLVTSYTTAIVLTAGFTCQAFLCNLSVLRLKSSLTPASNPVNV